MTSSLDLPEHLATPFEFRAIEPASFAGVAPSANPQGTVPPSFLTRADEFVDRHPDSPVAWARLAQAAQAAGHAEQAIEASRTALAMGINQQSLPAMHAAATVLLAYGHADVVEQAVRAHGPDSLPLDLSLWFALRSGADEVIEASTDDSATALVARGWIALRKADYHGAIRLMRRADRAGAGGAALYANLGYAHAALGQLEKAIKLTRQAAVLAPADRNIAMNLVGYFRAMAAHREAIAEIERVAGGKAPDIELALMLADLLHESGATRKAHDVLQRIRTSREWATSDRLRRNELEANLAFLRWATGKQDKPTTLSAVRRALANCGYESLAIAYLLMNLASQTSDAGLLASDLDALAVKHPAEDLYGIRMHLAILRHEAADAVKYAVAWAEHDIFDSTASALAVYLLTDAEGRADDAANLGVVALRRAPADRLLLNNTAYALCLADRAAEASRLLHTHLRSDDDKRNAVLTATCALAEMLTGGVENGIEGYRRARDLAREAQRPDLEARVVVNMKLAIHRLSARSDAEPDLPAVTTEWRDDPSFWILSRRVQRELGCSL